MRSQDSLIGPVALWTNGVNAQQMAALSEDLAKHAGEMGERAKAMRNSIRHKKTRKP